MLKRTILIVNLIVIFACLNAIIEETASFKAFIYGKTEDTSYDNWVSHVVEGVAQANFNQYPTWDKQKPGFGSYKKATPSEANVWKNVVKLFAEERYEEAEMMIADNSFPYEIVRFNDTDTGRTYYMLRELLNLEYFDDNGFPNNPELHEVGSFDYGWGIYVIDPSSNVPIIVNVVHPNDDFISPPFAAEAFQMWNARFFMVSGVGREALWTNEPPYFNSKSLSDPSRNLDHAFNRGYQAVCDAIRERFNRRELSVQIHSFDRTHMGLYPLQVSSTGPEHTYTSLPSRDLSGDFRDLVNFTPYVVHPANSIGLHKEILVTDYYAINYSEHGMFYNHDGTLLPISNDVALASYKTNQQMLYSNEGVNLYGTYNPFFHIEMDELPRCYPKTDESYDWFYGYDERTQRWDPDNFFTRMLDFYRPWMIAFNEIFPIVLELNDYKDPTSPSQLTAISKEDGAVSLSWERSYSYDFDSYEILYSNEPNVSEDAPFFDEKDIPVLACQAYETALIPTMPDNKQYYFKIRARDLNGNYSDLSNEATRYCGEVNLVNFTALGRSDQVELEWKVISQQGVVGFRIWRKLADDSDFEVIASWEDDPALEGSEETDKTYLYEDKEVVNGKVYEYQLSFVTNQQTEETYPQTVIAYPEKIYTLLIANDTGSLTNTVEFGYNRKATDEFDMLFDKIAQQPSTPPYLSCSFLHDAWPEEIQRLSTDIYGFYDPLLTSKVWNLAIKTSEINKRFTVSLVDEYPLDRGPLYLVDAQTGSFWDLSENQYVYTPSNTDEKLFYLFMGKVFPQITVTADDNKFYTSGDTFSSSWTIKNGLSIQKIELFLTDGVNFVQIADDLSATVTKFDWKVQDDVSISNARLLVRAYISELDYVDAYSPYKVGIIPREIEFDNVAGWHLKTNPHTTSQESGKKYFGDKAKLFRYNSGTDMYIESTVFSNDRGFWVFMPEDFYAKVDGPVQQKMVNQMANKGWNFLPNPHYADLRVQDISFFKNQKEYTYFEGIRASLILPVAFTARNNCYSPVETIKAGEAFWLYSNVDALIVRYKVMNQNDDYIPLNPTWSVKIIADKGAHLRDEVLIGHAPHTDEIYNPLYDLPKPKVKPLDKLNFYLREESEGYPFTRLYSNLKRELRPEYVDEVYWDFTIETNKDGKPINFYIESNNLPDGYKVVLILDEQMYELSPTHQFSYTPQREIIMGQIMLTNGSIASTESFLPTPERLFANYPNPFYASSSERSMGTIIPFNIEKPTKVQLDIYNIKGQKVITLLNDTLGAGYHQVNWSGRDDVDKKVAAGVYFYRLTTESGYSEVRKMLLMK